jgi:hypothetical protein
MFYSMYLDKHFYFFGVCIHYCIFLKTELVLGILHFLLQFILFC